MKLFYEVDFLSRKKHVGTHIKILQKKTESILDISKTYNREFFLSM